MLKCMVNMKKRNNIVTISRLSSPLIDRSYKANIELRALANDVLHADPVMHSGWRVQVLLTDFLRTFK